MKNIWLKIGLYISSFIPLYFLIIVKELIDIINENLSFNITNSVMLSFNFSLIICGIIAFIFLVKKTNYSTYNVVGYTNITRENFLPYFPLFVLFALAFELEFISMATVYIFILCMIGVVYIKNELFYINPFLNIIGFSLYKIKLDDGKTINIFSRKVPSSKILTNNFISK